MTPNNRCHFSTLRPADQQVIVQLLQEEFAPLVCLTADVTGFGWARAVGLVDPVLLYSAIPEPVIRICPTSYEQLRERLLQELAAAK